MSLLNKRKLCVIFNQIKFDIRIVGINKFVYLSDGYECDGLRMNKLFNLIGFKETDVRLMEDRTKVDIEKCLGETKKDFLSDEVELLIVIFISHGYKETIEAKDESMEIEKIISPFMCNELKEKQKLFIFQACRGDDIEKAIPTVRINHLETDDHSIINEDMESILTRRKNSVSHEEIELIPKTPDEEITCEVDKESNWFPENVSKLNLPESAEKIQNDSLCKVEELSIDAGTLISDAEIKKTEQDIKELGDINNKSHHKNSQISQNAAVSAVAEHNAAVSAVPEKQNSVNTIDYSLIDLSKLPIDANSLIAYATISGSKAFKDSQIGSYYIYFLYHVFMAHSHRLDVLEMLTLVNRLVARQVLFKKYIKNKCGVEECSECSPKDRYAQMPCFNSKLTKKFFLLSPKISSEHYGPFYNDDTNKAYTTKEEISLYTAAQKFQLTKELLLFDQPIPNYPFEREQNDNIYPGFCLIFTKTSIESNKRCKIDENNLTDLFQNTIRFSNKNILSRSYKNNEDISKIVEAETSNTELMKIKLFIVIVLSHADDEPNENDENGQIFGANDNKKTNQSLSLDYLVEPMKNCAEIRKIPKLFLIQAGELDLNSTIQKTKEGHCNIDMDNALPTSGYLPSESNMLFMYSNVVGTKEEEGTPLVKHFCESVKENSNDDLLSILTVVNQKLIYDIIKDGRDEKIKSPFIESRWTAKVMLT